MTQANKTNQTENVIVEYEAEGQKIKLSHDIIKSYLTNGQAITDSEFKMFTELCKAKKLNPFLKQAYIIKYGESPATIVVSKDVLIQRANTNPNFDGKENGIIVMNKETKETSERNGTFYSSNEVVVGGWCKVYRKDRKYPEYVSVSVDECAQKKSNGELNMNWANKKATMIEKVAVVRALRNAFPEEFNGMYVEEEMTTQKQETKEDPFAPKEEVEIIDVKAKEVDINSL